MPDQHITPETVLDNLRISLEGALTSIQRHYRVTDPQSARTKAIEIIDLFERHLDDLGVNRSLTRPLRDIKTAFAEAERGRSDPLFQPEPSAHRPPTEFWKLAMRGHAALAMDLLMAIGRKRKEAALEVVQRLKEHGVPIDGKPDVPEWKTVQGWREELAKAGGGAGWHGPDWTWYGSVYLFEKERLLRSVEEGSEDPKALAKRQLEIAAQNYPWIG